MPKTFKEIADEVELSNLPQLPLEDKRSLPDLPAVYFAVGTDSEILYVGRTASLRRRWKGNRHQHLETLYNRDEPIHLAWLAVEHEDWLPELEYELITRFRPVLNEQPNPTADQKAARQLNQRSRDQARTQKTMNRRLFQVGRVLSAYGIDTPQQAEELMQHLICQKESRDWLRQTLEARETEHWMTAGDAEA